MKTHGKDLTHRLYTCYYESLIFYSYCRLEFETDEGDTIGREKQENKITCDFELPDDVQEEGVIKLIETYQIC